MPYWANCEKLYKELNDCLAQNSFARLLGTCKVQEDALLECAKVEYIAKKRASRDKARDKQERVDALAAETGLPTVHVTALKPRKQKTPATADDSSSSPTESAASA